MTVPKNETVFINLGDGLSEEYRIAQEGGDYNTWSFVDNAILLIKYYPNGVEIRKRLFIPMTKILYIRVEADNEK